jgi:hypothetical protein
MEPVMPSDNKVSQLILRLTKATVDGEVEWESTAPPIELNRTTDDVIESYHQTELKGQTIAIFERRFRAYDGEHDVQYWAGANSIAILRKWPTEVIWEHQENSSSLGNLIRIAKEKSSGIDGILDNLLK